MFEKAARLKLRFETAKGNLTVEDLWDLSLEKLDKIARDNYEQLEHVASFIKTESKPDELTRLKFDLVKHIIDVKLSEQQNKQDALLKKQKKERILEIIRDKEEESLRGKSLEELKGLLGEV